MSANPWKLPPPKTSEDTRRDFDALFKVVSPEPAPLQTTQAPSITVQLESKETVPCRAVSFWIEAEGTAPLTFVWRRNGKDFKTQLEEGDGLGWFIASETTYTHTALDLTDDGAVFDVVVSNAAGSVTSIPATLTVKAKPVKTEQEQIADMLQVPMSVRKKAKGHYYQDMDVHFQPYQFSLHPIFRGASSHSDVSEWSDGKNWDKGLGDFVKGGAKEKIHYQKGPSHGVDADGYLNDHTHVQLFNGLNKGTGISVLPVESDPASQGHRTDIPRWLWLLHFSEYSKYLPDFLLRLANKKMKPEDHFKEGRDIRPVGSKALIEAAGLDYLILRDYYIQRREDKEIFERYEEDFKREKKHQRRTSSPDAVKHRRLRLVAAGDRLYLLPKDDSVKS